MIIPVTEELLKCQIIDPKTVQHELKQSKLKQKFYYDAHRKYLSKLQVGDHVLMQKKRKWRSAKVICVRQDTPHSYDIRTSDGQTYRRNRHHLKKAHNSSDQEIYLDDNNFLYKVNAPVINSSEVYKHPKQQKNSQ